MELSKEETKAIGDLKRLAKRWPKSLWIFSASGHLMIMRKDDNGDVVMNRNGGVDQSFVVTEILGISNDGGDW